MDCNGTPVVTDDVVVVQGLPGRVDLEGQTGRLVSCVEKTEGHSLWAVNLGLEIVTIEPGTKLHVLPPSSSSSSSSFFMCHITNA